MWKQLIVLFAVLGVCCCDDGYSVKRRPYHHHYDPYYSHLLYGGSFAYYLVFLLIKVKVVFVLGTIFTFMLFFGKLYAIIKYSEYMKSDHHHHEKVYDYAPAGYSGAHGGITYDAPPESFSSPYSSGITLDKPPSGAEHYFDSPPQRLGRNYGEGGLYENLDLFMGMIRKLNITETAFKSMKLEGDDCKRKFVCEADFNAKHSVILATGLELLSDDSYDKYKTNETITSMEECGRLYPKCQEKVS